MIRNAVCISLCTLVSTTFALQHQHKPSTYHVPRGPFVLHEHLFNTRSSVVFRVTDSNSNTFSLKVFSYLPHDSTPRKTEQLLSFGSDRATMMKLTKSLCPQLMEVRSTDEPVDVTCDASHIELLAGLDVSVIDESGNPVSTLDMNITNSQGVERLRRVTFGSNMLVPFVSGGRLGDLADNSPLFRSILNRFLVYTYISTQLVEAVKKLHSLGVVHGGISPSNIYCVSASCEEVVLGEFSRAYTEKDPLLPSLKYALEISQDSVRMMAMEKDLKDDVDPKITKMLMDYASKPVTWDSARKVDWFGLGGALFYVVSGSRFYVDSMDSSKTSSRMLSDFIFASLSQKEMTNRVTDTKSKAALEKIRDQVAEGLALIDGLLVVDRSKRISFDTELGRSRMTTSLRANKAVLSALQTDSKVLGNTCASFLKETRRILGSDSKDETIPSFIQQIC